MQAAAAAKSIYSALATIVLLAHGLFILWVIFGAFLTRRRRTLRWLHIASLIWAILAEFVWICPLTLLENWLEGKGGIQPYEGGFLLHYLDRLIYPDLPAWVVTLVGVLVCAVNLGFYVRQAVMNRH